MPEEFPSSEELYKDAIAKTEAERASMANYEKQLMAKSGTTPAAPAQDFNPQYQKVLGQEEQSVQDIKAANEQAQAHAAAAAAAKAPYIKGAQDEIQKQLDNPITPPTPPQFGPVPNQGQYIDQTAAKAMFAVASMMAALGMAGGRGRGMLAMAGMTGALAGFNEGNYEKYKEGMDQYKTQVEEQIASYNMQMRDYQARMDQQGLTLEQRKNLLELETLKWNDVVGQDILKQQGAEGLFKYYDDMRKTVDGMAKAANQQLIDPYKLQIAQANAREAEARAKVADFKAQHPENPDDNKPGPAGMYYDKQTGDFLPSLPTRGELRDPTNQGRFVRMGAPERQMIDFLKFGRTQIEQLKPLAKKVLTGPVSGTLSSIFSPYHSGGQDMQDFKQRVSMLVNEAGKLEQGGSRLAQGMRQSVVEQMPTPSMDAKVAERKLNTLDTQFKGRLESILGKGSMGPDVLHNVSKSGKPIHSNDGGQTWEYDQ